KLSKLRIEIAAETPGLTIKRDGAVVGRPVVGVALPIDPGEHVVSASAPGFVDWTSKVVVGPTPGETTVSIPALEKRPEAAPKPPVAAPPPVTPPPPDPPKSGFGPLGIAGFAIAGAGVATLAVGGVFAGLAASDYDGAESDPALCPGKVCTPA